MCSTKTRVDRSCYSFVPCQAGWNGVIAKMAGSCQAPRHLSLRRNVCFIVDHEFEPLCCHHYFPSPWGIGLFAVNAHRLLGGRVDFVICGESTVTLKKHNPDPGAGAENDDVGGRRNTGAEEDLSQFNRGGDDNAE